MQQEHQRTYRTATNECLYIGQLLSHLQVFLYLENKVILSKDNFFLVGFCFVLFCVVLFCFVLFCFVTGFLYVALAVLKLTL